MSLGARSFRPSDGVFALIALAVGVALGPDGASGVGGACVAVGLVGATCALRPATRRHPRRSAGRRDVRRELGPELMALEMRGWLVSESVPAGGRGEIDFLVTTPAVSFLIDVAEGGERAAAARLGRQVAWARERYGPGRQIEPVLCGEGPVGAGQPAGGARRVAPSRLVPFLLDRG